MFPFRLGLACALIGVASALIPQSVRADEVPDKPSCEVANASLITPLDSRNSRAGDVFRFSASVGDAGVAGTGYGVVNFVRGAGRGGYPGEIGIEARYVQLADGTRVSAMIAPVDHSTGVANGRTKNAPFFLSALSLAKGSGFHLAAGVLGIYNLVHSGTQARIPNGTPMRIILGDDYLLGACTLT
jgi:hypothetical protein